MKKTQVGILGATGVIGQTYVSLLHDHPWFEIGCLTSSKTGAYDAAVSHRWHHASPIPKNYQLTAPKPCPLLFNALPQDPDVEHKAMISSSPYHRTTAPLIIPEINPHHIKGHKTLAKPNCTVQTFLLPLAPLHREARITALSVTTLQALSGGGNQTIASKEMENNVIPFIGGEEEKCLTEPLQILEADFPIEAACNRVPVLHGHLVCVSVQFAKKLTREEILELWAEPSTLDLPSAPKHPIIYTDAPDRPQPKHNLQQAMSVTVGRLRPSPLFDWQFVALAHNAVRGGAGGGLLLAELLKQEGTLG